MKHSGRVKSLIIRRSRVQNAGTSSLTRKRGSLSYHSSTHPGGVDDVTVDVRAPEDVVEGRKHRLHRLVRVVGRRGRGVVAELVQLGGVVVEREHRRIHG